LFFFLLLVLDFLFFDPFPIPDPSLKDESLTSYEIIGLVFSSCQSKIGNSLLTLAFHCIMGYCFEFMFLACERLGLLGHDQQRICCR